MRDIPDHVRREILRGNTTALSRMGRKGGRSSRRRHNSMISPGVRPSFDPEIAPLLRADASRLGEDENEE